MGKIFLEQNELNRAKEAWEKATANNPNKGELYYQLAQLHTTQLKDYERASAYYDSAAVSLSNAHPTYTKVQKLQTDWKQYILLDRKIKLQDSLQKLSNLPLNELQSLYNTSKAKKINKQDSIQKSQIQRVKSPAVFTRRPSTSEQQSFYFYNELARVKGEQEFNMKWGIRNLEDFWDRKNKQNAPISIVTSTSLEPTEISKSANVVANIDSMQIWLESIPTTDAKRLASNKIKEQALFDLGKYCKTQMENDALANLHLNRLLSEYPYTVFEAEALYLNYLSAENKVAKQSIKTRLFDRFPDSIYKLTILKLETGILSDSKEVQAEKAYEEAYLAFKAKSFDSALLACQQIRVNFPGSKSEDKIVFLSALCYAGLKNPTEYLKTLKQFVQLFPLSPLKAEADARINAIPQNK
jgi:tetratricopeptide (TPR) repeat protein